MIDINSIKDSHGYEDRYLEVKRVMGMNATTTKENETYEELLARKEQEVFKLVKKEFPDAELIPREKTSYIVFNFRIAGLHFYNMEIIGNGRQEINLRYKPPEVSDLTDEICQIIRTKSDLGYLINEIKKIDNKEPSELAKQKMTEVDFIVDIRRKMGKEDYL